jgi:hypothetical protein
MNTEGIVFNPLIYSFYVSYFEFSSLIISLNLLVDESNLFISFNLSVNCFSSNLISSDIFKLSTCLSLL